MPLIKIKDYGLKMLGNSTFNHDALLAITFSNIIALSIHKVYASNM